VWSFTTEAHVLGAPLDASIPARLRLAVAPNPSRGTLRLSVDAPAGGYQRLEVLDVMGRVVRRLGVGSDVAGRWTLSWEGRDDTGHRLPQGLYFARLSSRSRAVTLRLILLD
jgi:hypothetical protein